MSHGLDHGFVGLLRPTGGGAATAIIKITELTRRFGDLTALNNVSLDIERGELFGLLGPNGAGKTTLISILSTLLSPTSGAAVVCGHDVRKDEDAVRRSIGVVFQDPSLDDELTGQENLDFHGRLYGLDSETRYSRVDEVLHLVDLEDRRHDLVKTYSGGMRRRLEIARGLMHRPQVLFLDEPTLGLDPQTRRKIWNYIRGLKESYGMTIILTTHYMDEADQLCSRVAIIDHGVIVALDSPVNLKAGLGGDLLELETPAVHPDFVERLRNSQEVGRVSAKDGRVILTVNKGESFIPRVFETAQSLGMEISSVSMRKPNLEDVFIKLTGREIREETISEPKERFRIYMWGRRR
ncbi:MAG: ATP-binding cassette domain-containing protein [Desulfomonile tiedjei]|nr:ATP-binding cassette domain-containing protein [Desulfomonile tiedjei]